MKTNTKNDKWDKHNSTYARILVLENGAELTGYSKMIGFEERRDKTDVLQNDKPTLFKCEIRHTKYQTPLDTF